MGYYNIITGMNNRLGLGVRNNWIHFTITNISEGNTDHSALDNLDYENSGHTDSNQL